MTKKLFWSQIKKMEDTEKRPKKKREAFHIQGLYKEDARGRFIFC